MGAPTCPRCGNPLPPGARTCAACGYPVPGAVATSSAAVTSRAPPPPPGSPRSLGIKLGIEGTKEFLLEHELLPGGHNYRVTDSDGRLLFTVEEDIRQELGWNIFFRPSADDVPSTPSPGGNAPPPLGLVTYVWTVVDASAAPQAQIMIRLEGADVVSSLSDLWGTPILSVRVSRTLLGDLQATATYPDGQGMFQSRGNLLSHDFSIQDPSGHDVAKVRQAWVSPRNTFRLDLVGDVDPLGPLVYAMLIDREK